MSEVKTIDPISPEDAGNIEIMQVKAVKSRKVPVYTSRAIKAYALRCLESKKFFCDPCNKAFRDQTALNTHIATNIHTPHPPRPRKHYDCELCNFHTLIKTAMTKHCTTAKHQRNIGASAKSEATNLAGEHKLGEIAHIVLNCA